MTPIKRRDVLRISGGVAVSLTLLPKSAWADKPAMQKSIRDMFGDKPIQDGRVTLTIPTLSENGYSVSMDVDVESPMTENDYVTKLAIFSERNPIPLIAAYHFTPASGRARIASNIRLGGTQNVHAIAQMSDGSLWRASAKTFVTLAACVVL